MLKRFVYYCAMVIVSLTAPAAAELIAYDPFDYSDISSSLFGREGGTGFVGTWHAWGAPNHTNYKIVEGSLSYPGLLTDGNSVTSQAMSGSDWTAVVHTLEDMSDTTTTKYLSFLMRPEGIVGGGANGGSFGVMIDGTGGRGDIAVGKAPGQSQYMIETFYDIASRFSNVPIQSGVTSLMVVKAELGPGNDTFTLFVDPIPGEPEPPTGTVKNDLDIGRVAGIVVGSAGGLSVDELRWGDTFEDVTPTILSPPVAGDFDGDRILTVADIDLLTSAVNMPAPSPTFDLNQDGKVDATDRMMWVKDLKNTWFGDANLDRQVNAADLNALALNWRRTDADSWNQGEFTGDGIVNAADLNALALNWRSGVDAVPEPAGFLLLAIGLGLAVQRCRRG